MQPPQEPTTPLQALGALARQEVRVDAGLRHVEVFTMAGLLTVLWHGPPDAEAVVLCCGGAMGGLLGPADGLYHDLGRSLGAQGVGVLRVGYRRPNDLDRCVHDVLAAAELAARAGAATFLTVGHSFGGAVALRAGVAFGDVCAGVVTLATQSAGCEVADELAPTPLLLLHGDRDELLPLDCSAIVRELAGQGELVVLPGAGHLLTEAGTELRARLGDWIPARLAALTPPQR